MQFLATLVPNGTALVISLVSAFVTRLNLYSRLRQSYARLNLYFRLQQTFATRGTARPALPQSFEDAGVQVGAVAEERIVDGKVFPLTLMPTASSLPSSRVSFVREHNEEILQLVHEYGAVLLRGWGSDSAENFSQISAALRLATTDMACSAGPRFEVAKNIFTANEAPPSERIPFHHEMAQCDKPPSVVCFFCDTAAPHGGATPILQSHLAATYLRTRHPEVADKLVEKEVRYVRIMPPVTDPSSALGKSWRHSLRVESEAEAEAKLAELESTWTWLPGGMLRTVTKPMPAVLREERTGREVFFTAAESTLNSIVDEVNGIGATESQANDIRPIKAIIYGDGSPLDEATKLALHDVTQYMIAQQVAVPWQPGDALLIDNATVQHSREAFTPPRRILASLVGGLSKVGSLHEVPQATKTPMMSVSPSTTMDMLQMGKQPSMSL